MPHTQWVISAYERSSAQYSADKTTDGKFRLRRLECDGFPVIPLGKVETEERAKRMLEFFVKHDRRIHAVLVLALKGQPASLTDILIEAATQC